MTVPVQPRSFDPRPSSLSRHSRRFARSGLIAGIAGLLFAAGVAPVSAADISTVPVATVRDNAPTWYALTHARIVVSPGKVIEDGTLEIRDGRIRSVKAGLSVPAGASERDMQGLTIYPGFIEMAGTVGVPEDMRRGGIKPRSEQGTAPREQQADQPGARHWNRRVRPELSVSERLSYKDDEAKSLRELGFVAALAAPDAGIVQGRSALLSLRPEGDSKSVLLADNVAEHIGFDFAWGSEYPTSLTGAIALIRQTLLDSRWQHSAEAWSRQHRDAARPQANMALDALFPAASGVQPVFFRLENELDVARVRGLRDEFGLRLTAYGSGYEYRVLDSLRGAGFGMVLPLDFPDAPELEKADVAREIGLSELQHWEQAPANPARVAAVGVEIALSSHGLDKPAESFWPNLRRAVKAGLSADRALAALTTAPAKLLGASDRLGSLEAGKLASFVVADQTLFSADDAVIHEVWVEGVRSELKPLQATDGAGRWTLRWSDGRGPASWTLSKADDGLGISAGDVRVGVRQEDEGFLALVPRSWFASDAAGQSTLRWSQQGERLRGFRLAEDGRRVAFTASRDGSDGAAADKSASTGEEVADASVSIPAFAGYPAGAFARRDLPMQPEAVLFRDATVWTNTDAGIVENTDVLVRKGRIATVGADLDAPSGAVEVDASGMHLTPGIIDAHSHSALQGGVNEAGDAISAEVRMSDVLDPTDIAIYRELAGGVTTANLLHGSANPIGGRNAVIKLRWGGNAKDLRFEGAMPGIKFALGENVKQSGWGDAYTTRYPQTRMGVNEIDRDAFDAALKYAAEREASTRKGAAPFRRDLRLETLAEILAGERLIHIHSYRQDEILNFVRLAQDYKLPVATFQHVLEGYKVADAIRELGAGASTFSDWWAYKMEVFDAIPYNGALLTEVGVTTSFNSDSDELARRLNTEAAKAMHYGGLSAEQALKLVTLNPARQLRIDDRVGSIAVGKDADLVLWSASPLSAYARAEQTWIDGRRYFDREEDARLQQVAQSERQRISQKILEQRMKALKLARKAPADEQDDTEADAKAPERYSEQWCAAAFQRGLYHDGHDLAACRHREAH
ncbi:MAG: amidohydrolase family protein [Xanthomonadales bacterium]|nr:amidohydrolase family protein [Xanthomonadales bacterium]